MRAEHGVVVSDRPEAVRRERPMLGRLPGQNVRCHDGRPTTYFGPQAQSLGLVEQFGGLGGPVLGGGVSVVR
jgi:hypothetical protein